MLKTVVGAFRDYNQAESVLNDLVHSGFVREDITIVPADRTGAAGATAPANEPSYAESVTRGGTLVAIRTEGDRVERAESILNQHGAVDLRASDGSWRETDIWRPDDPHNQAENFGSEGGTSDWGKTRDTADTRQGNLATDRSPVSVYDPEQSTAPDLSDPVLMQHYEECWRHKMNWDEFGEAYRLGQALGASGRYGNSQWVDVESDARRHWEAHRPDTWHNVNDVVRFGWDHFRGKR